MNNNNVKSPSINLKGGMIKDLRISIDGNNLNSPKGTKNQSPGKMIEMLKGKFKIESPKTKSPSLAQGSFNYNNIILSKNSAPMGKALGSPDRVKQGKFEGKNVDLNNNLNDLFSHIKNSSLFTAGQVGLISSNNYNNNAINRKPTEMIKIRSRSKDKDRKKSNSPLKFNNLFNSVNLASVNRNVKRREDENVNNNNAINHSNISNPNSNSNSNINNITPMANIQVIQKKDQPEKQLSCFQEYAYKEEKNLKFRNAMEDFSKIVDKYMGEANKAFFSLYDGHGGTDPVIYVKDRMPDLLQKCLQAKDLTIENAIIQAFNKIDDELKLCDSENTGCTACVVYIIIESGKRSFYCANVGDSRCVIVTSDEAVTITHDHKCSDTNEVERVRESGGIVFSGRVFGQLVLTRALGDHALKEYGVISTPYVTKTELEDKHKYAVMASDGVWDVIQMDEVYKISQNVTNAEDFAKTLVKNAVDGGSKDNISCIVIKLN
jgi:serine/threonine protein phosphatase PrpC